MTDFATLAARSDVRTAPAKRCCVSNMPKHQCRESPALRTYAPKAAKGRYLSNSARSNFRSLLEPLALSALVVHLFEAVVALIVTPIDEDRSVIDTRAILAPTFKSHMGLGQGSYGRSLP